MLLAGVCAMNAQSGKVVIDSHGNVEGRYVRTNKHTYTVNVQDFVDVPKRGRRVVTYSAVNGQGVVYYNQERTGNLNVRQRPTKQSPVIAQIPEPGDYVPDCFPCLGKVNGWYKVNVDGQVGYVRQDLLDWDSICTF